MSRFNTLRLIAARTTLRLAQVRALPAVFGGAVTALCTSTYAALPTIPAGVPSSGNYVETMRDYTGLVIGLIALVIMGYSFLAVAGGSVAKFKDWQAGKAELGDLKLVFAVGALLLISVVYVLTQAIGVIATSGTFAGG
jgi:integrating conjugative element membrane protein (TIGR03745 family)